MQHFRLAGTCRQGPWLGCSSRQTGANESTCSHLAGLAFQDRDFFSHAWSSQSLIALFIFQLACTAASQAPSTKPRALIYSLTTQSSASSTHLAPELRFNSASQLPADSLQRVQLKCHPLVRAPASAWCIKISSRGSGTPTLCLRRPTLRNCSTSPTRAWPAGNTRHLDSRRGWRESSL